MPATVSASLELPELFTNDNPAPYNHFAAHLIAQVQREMSTHKRRLLRTVARWLDLHEYVKLLEAEHLATEEPMQAQTQFLVATLSVVRGLGVMLLTKLDSAEAKKIESLDLTYSDLAACVEELADMERALCSDVTNQMVGEMNQKLFGIPR